VCCELGPLGSKSVITPEGGAECKDKLGEENEGTRRNVTHLGQLLKECNKERGSGLVHTEENWPCPSAEILEGNFGGQSVNLRGFCRVN
jgi:hypothetical protein